MGRRWAAWAIQSRFMIARVQHPLPHILALPPTCPYPSLVHWSEPANGQEHMSMVCLHPWRRTRAEDKLLSDLPYHWFWSLWGYSPRQFGLEQMCSCCWTAARLASRISQKLVIRLPRATIPLEPNVNIPLGLRSAPPKSNANDSWVAPVNHSRCWQELWNLESIDGCPKWRVESHNTTATPNWRSSWVRGHTMNWSNW